MRTEKCPDYVIPDDGFEYTPLVPGCIERMEQPAKKAAHYLQELMRKRYHFFTELERLSLEKAYEIIERAEIREERCSLC